jgi:2,5-diketo-D-gluconate reductase B
LNLLFQKNFQRVFGTYPLKQQAVRDAIALAIDVGYRAFDTAQMYGNEADVGDALAQSAVSRDELCIITKVHPDNYLPETFLKSVEDSLRHLRVAYVDALLLHWPPISGDVTGPLRLLQTALEAGFTRNIGLSNFNAAMMRKARSLLDVPIVTNQVEFHPLLDQSVLLVTAATTGIPLSSYASVARGEVFRYQLFEELGRAYGRTPGQVALRWTLQKGVSLATMSTRLENIRANYDIMDFVMSSVDMARIDALGKVGYRIVTRDRAPWAPDFD